MLGSRMGSGVLGASRSVASRNLEKLNIHHKLFCFHLLWTDIGISSFLHFCLWSRLPMAPILRTSKLTGKKLFPGKKTQFTKNRVGLRILFHIWPHTTVIFFMEERSKLQNKSDWPISPEHTLHRLTCLQLLSPHTRPPSHSSSPSQSPSPATQGSALVQHRPWSTFRPAQRNAEDCKYQVCV